MWEKNSMKSNSKLANVASSTNKNTFVKKWKDKEKSFRYPKAGNLENVNIREETNAVRFVCRFLWHYLWMV
jgi:hypothetical protein